MSDQFHDGHSHDGHSHDHGHSHEILDGPGSYLAREPPIIEGRDWSERAFTIGIGGHRPPASWRVNGLALTFVCT